MGALLNLFPHTQEKIRPGLAGLQEDYGKSPHVWSKVEAKTCPISILSSLPFPPGKAYSLPYLSSHIGIAPMMLWPRVTEWRVSGNGISQSLKKCFLEMFSIFWLPNTEYPSIWKSDPIIDLKRKVKPSGKGSSVEREAVALVNHLCHLSHHTMPREPWFGSHLPRVWTLTSSGQAVKGCRSYFILWISNSYNIGQKQEEESRGIFSPHLESLNSGWSSFSFPAWPDAQITKPFSHQLC